MGGWVAAVLLGWLLIAGWTIALLTAAKRGDAAVEPHAGRGAAVAGGLAAAGAPAGLRPPAPGVLTALARAVREELAVDQVLIVVRDQRAPQRAVAVAVAGLPVGLLGR